VTIDDRYAGIAGVVVYDYPSPVCAVLGIGLSGGSFTQSIQRAKYFASLVAGTYTIAPTDLVECIPACHTLDTTKNSITLTDIPTGLSVIWDDPNNWTFVTT
jgi:hypothetical protein